MKKLRKSVYLTAGYNTVALGPGRKEFHPKKPRPRIEHYIKEAGEGALAKINDPANVDEGVISNFMASRFCRQGNLAGFFPFINKSFLNKPATRVEGACGSGGLALVTALKSVLADISDSVLTLGVEVQNSVKAVYGADILAGAGYYAGERKQGHAYFFPAKFSDRAGAYYDKVGADDSRKAMAVWYSIAVENARKCTQAQEHHNKTEDLIAVGMTKPNTKSFLPNLNIFDCSKVSDGASACIICSEDGLKKLGVNKKDTVEIIGFGQAEGNITVSPPDLTKLSVSAKAVQDALIMAGIKISDVSTIEVHDCFTITGLLSVEACGLAEYGKGFKYVLDGKSKTEVPINTTGGLVGHGHYTGGTGVRQANTLWEQLTDKAGDYQVKIDKPYGLMISMGGNDMTVVAMVFKKSS